MSWWPFSDRRKGGVAALDRAADDLPAGDGTPLIRLEAISKVFKGDADEETHALSDVTLDIPRGQYVSIAGPSGCGKSTLLAVLALLESPTAGRYWLNGRAAERLSPAERARARNVDIGLIFQSFNLIGDMTVYRERGVPVDGARRLGAGAPAEGHDRARTRRPQRPGKAAAGIAVGRPPAARGDRPRLRRPSADPARRRAHRQPGLEERRERDAHARRAARRRRHRLPRDAQPGVYRPGRASNHAVRRNPCQVRSSKVEGRSSKFELRTSTFLPTFLGLAPAESPRAAPGASDRCRRTGLRGTSHASACRSRCDRSDTG